MISVALCTSDDAPSLPFFLESLIAQQTRPDELVVRDDRSVDDSVKILETFRSKAAFPVRVTVNERRLGPSPNLGVCLSDCTHDVIAVASAGDVWVPSKLRETMGAFAAHPEAGLVVANARAGETTVWDAAGLTPDRRRGDVLPLLVSHAFISATTSAMRADVRDAICPIPEHVAIDPWVAVIAAVMRPVIFIDEVLAERSTAEVAPPTGAMPDESPVERQRTHVKSARRKLSIRDADLHRQGRRAQSTFYRSALERVAERGISSPGAETALTEMRDRAEHLQIRGTLPDSRAKRVAIVLGEVRSGRYARYSSGFFSALQDLAY